MSVNTTNPISIICFDQQIPGFQAVISLYERYGTVNIRIDKKIQPWWFYILHWS